MHSLVMCSCILMGLVLAAVGCGRSSPDQLPQDFPQEEKQTAKPKVIVQPTDESLTSDQYLEMGVPAHDRPWFANDMRAAAKVLAKLIQTNPKHFPRYQSRQSGEVFARINSPQNLEFARNRTLPLETRFPQALASWESANQIFKLYLAAFLKKATGDSELVECFGYQFRNTIVILELVDEFIPTLDPKDADYKVRMGGVIQMKQGLASIVVGCLITLTEKDAYRDSELIRLVGYMKESFPSIIPRLLPASRTEALNRLETMNNDAGFRTLQPGLKELNAQVRAAVKKEKAP